MTQVTEREAAAATAATVTEMTTAAAVALFDRLEPAPAEMMTGRWRGEGIRTGHAMDGMLEATRWHGKKFDGPDAVHPLVHRGLGGGLYCVNPALLAIRATTAMPFRDPILRAVFPLAGPLLATRRHRARLRSILFRGRLHAAMLYDAKPINDVFARIDDDRVMGWMDFKGMEQPYFFRLIRE